MKHVLSSDNVDLNISALSRGASPAELNVDWNLEGAVVGMDMAVQVGSPLPLC